MRKYTPGPWKINEFGFIVGPSGKPAICDPCMGYFSEQRRVDAQLIAAAPDMRAKIDRLEESNAELLAALKGLGSCCCDEVWDRWSGEPHSPECRAVQAAIAKATGESE